MMSNTLVKKYLLTVRQLEIMQLTVEKEYHPKEIAKELSVTVSAVREHIGKIKTLYECESWLVCVIRYMKECKEN